MSESDGLGIEMTDEERAAATELADSDNPLAPYARAVLYLDASHSGMDSSSVRSSRAAN